MVIGERMRDLGLIPDRVLCSSALRTRETLLGVLPAILPAMPADAAIELSAGLYGASGSDYVGLIAGQAEAARTLLVIGHNPATQVTAGRLAGEGDRDKIADIARKFPTAALAVIDFEGDDWSGVVPGAGRLIDFIRPR